jgi:glycogen(starch) synthase
MRILVITNMYPPHAYGGYEQSCEDVVERWRRAGHEVLVLTSSIRVPDVPETDEDPTQVRRNFQLYWADHEILNPPLYRRLLWENANKKELDRALNEFRPDVVSAWAMGAMSMGLLGRLAKRGLPVVSVICDEWPVYGLYTDAWARPLSHRPRLARVVAVATGLETRPPPLDTLGPGLFNSDFLRNVVRERSPWDFPESSVVYSGIETSEFPFSARPADRWNWRLLYVGRIDPRKGIDTAIRALTQLPPEAKLEVIGRGDDRHLGELEALATELGVFPRVSFSFLPREELVTKYANADVVVFPSRWEEPLGLVPVEAMAVGVPVVGTPVGGAAEFLDNAVNCLTFVPDDVEGLVKNLWRLADDPALRDRLIAGGRITAGELGVDRLSEVLEDWHRYVAGEAGAEPPRDRPGLTHAGHAEA